MVKSWMYVGVLAVAFGLNGCGGSSGGSAAPGDGLALASYEAVLPDGTPMVLDLVADQAGVCSGSFAVDATSGQYADQTGTIFGTVSGDQLSMDCSADDGTTFQMTGSVNGSQELRLTRSDLPGQVLTFTRISESRGRGEISFFLDGLSGTKGRVVLGSDPVSTTTIGNQTVREYRGTWLGVPVNFWSYSTGVSSVVVYNDPLCVTTLYLTNYSPADFTSKTATAVNGSMTVYNTTLKTQIRFKTLPTVSP